MNILNILSFFKKESYECEALNTHLHFTSRNSLVPCCCINVGPTFLENLSEYDSICSYINIKQKYINMLRNGKIPNNCKNCISLKKIKKNKKKQNNNLYKINYITLNHYISCDCACIYCSQGNTTIDTIKQNFDEKIYDVKNFIKELYINNLIDKEALFINFQGGNISCLKDHEELIKLFLENGVKKISIKTNNIVYIPIIEELLKTKKGEIVTSLDSGTKETFNKIKQVNKFDQYVNNLKKYITIAGNNDIYVKYIIIKDINDNIEEITSFINTMKQVGIRFVCFDLDYRMTIGDTEKQIPEYYRELIKEVEEKCKKNNVEYTINPYAEMIIKRGKSYKNR